MVDNLFTNFYDEWSEFDYEYKINDGATVKVSLKCNYYLDDPN